MHYLDACNTKWMNGRRGIKKKVQTRVFAERELTHRSSGGMTMDIMTDISKEDDSTARNSQQRQSDDKMR
jgi:hypothetical protein